MQQEADVQSNPAQIEQSVEQKILERTFRRVQNLRVEMIRDQIVIHGSTKYYYVKLLVLEAAKEVLASTCPIPLLDDIQVT